MRLRCLTHLDCVDWSQNVVLSALWRLRVLACDDYLVMLERQHIRGRWRNCLNRPNQSTWHPTQRLQWAAIPRQIAFQFWQFQRTGVRIGHGGPRKGPSVATRSPGNQDEASRHPLFWVPRTPPSSRWIRGPASPRPWHSES